MGDQDTAVVAIILREGKILLGLREYATGNRVWTVPGGRCDKDETLEQTLRRETQEEVGISDLRIEKYIGSVNGAKTGDTVHMYYCESNQEPINKEPHKFNSWKWFSPEEIPDNFINQSAQKVLIEFIHSMK